MLSKLAEGQSRKRKLAGEMQRSIGRERPVKGDLFTLRGGL